MVLTSGIAVSLAGEPGSVSLYTFQLDIACAVRKHENNLWGQVFWLEPTKLKKPP